MSLIMLASASERRKKLLEQIGISCQVMPVDIDETPRPKELPVDYVRRLAIEKAVTCQQRFKTTLPILAADTVVALGNDIFGKPQNKAHGKAMLLALSGKTHQVFSGLCLLGQKQQNLVSINTVTFRLLSEMEIETYWQTGEPDGKAGSYAIQGLGSVFISNIEGSFSGIMGLPLFETAQPLQREGIEVL